MTNSWTNTPHIFNLAELENKKILLYHNSEYIDFEELQKISNWQEADKIFIVGQEAEFADFVFNDPRIYVWDSLYLADRDKFYSYFFWWHQANEVEYYENNIAKLSDPLTCAPEKIFEFLIGTTHRAPQRNYIKDLIIKGNLENLVFNNFDKGYISGSDIDISGSMEIVYNQVQTANRSTVLPYIIYNQSWFSIVSESLGNKRFFTEKTAKAFLGKRLFVFIGAQHALQDLKMLGYKTFDSIIDERYDSIENDYDRWLAAFEQIQFICRCNPAEIYNKALPILEHNQKTFLKQDWLETMSEQMKKIANDK